MPLAQENWVLHYLLIITCGYECKVQVLWRASGFDECLCCSRHQTVPAHQNHRERSFLSPSKQERSESRNSCTSIINQRLEIEFCMKSLATCTPINPKAKGNSHLVPARALPAFNLQKAESLRYLALRIRDGGLKSMVSIELQEASR